MMTELGTVKAPRGSLQIRLDFRAAALIHVAVKELLGIKSDVDLRERS